MANIYRFSPIESKETLESVFEYIATQLEGLSVKIFKNKLPITTLKVFSHYQDEYEYLHKIIVDMGNPAPFNSKTSYYSMVKRKIQSYDITYLGVRIVDPYRLHVGCGDYEIEEFEKFKKKYTDKTKYVRQFRDEKMLEVWHPDFDVLGYVIPSEK